VLHSRDCFGPARAEGVGEAQGMRPRHGWCLAMTVFCRLVQEGRDQSRFRRTGNGRWPRGRRVAGRCLCSPGRREGVREAMPIVASPVTRYGHCESRAPLHDRCDARPPGRRSTTGQAKQSRCGSTDLTPAPGRLPGGPHRIGRAVGSGRFRRTGHGWWTGGRRRVAGGCCCFTAEIASARVARRGSGRRGGCARARVGVSQ